MRHALNCKHKDMWHAHSPTSIAAGARNWRWENDISNIKCEFLFSAQMHRLSGCGLGLSCLVFRIAKQTRRGQGLWPWPAIKVKSARRHGTIYHKQMIATSRCMKWRLRNWEWLRKWRWEWQYSYWEGGQCWSRAAIQGWQLLGRGRGCATLKRLSVKRIFISISCARSRWLGGLVEWQMESIVEFSRGRAGAKRTDFRRK